MGFIRTRTILAHGTEEPLDFLQRIDYLQHFAPWHLEEAKSAGVWRPAWTAIPNFVDMHIFRPGDVCASDRQQLRAELGIPPNAVVVLCAAAIKRSHKRIDYVLNEMVLLRQRLPDAPLWLIVAGGWEQETDELIAAGQRLLGDRVQFLVRFARDRMPQLYRAADVFVLGSLKEMMPIALLEALASGLPCVVHAHPVMQWMVGPGGLTPDLSNDGALAAVRIETLARETERRHGLSRLARQHCLANFSEGAVVDRILDYYQCVADCRIQLAGKLGRERAWSSTNGPMFGSGAATRFGPGCWVRV